MPSSTSARSGAPEIEKVVDKQVDELRRWWREET
jgi:hypothetical protein